MRYKIRGFSDAVKLTDQSFLEVLSSGLPAAEIESVVDLLGLARARQRKLSAAMGIILAIAMSLWARQSLSRVLYKLIKVYRFLLPGVPPVAASKGAISQLR